ncbi:hypothetical protein HER32_11710 [Hymenobacter sp. BT18]|uniref:Hpt domain-containing protein n=1 Tax=Hymenobacter sp. BT18 TaxID=2835648 RepID=UPI00143EBCB2|nr:Hpt domain-containing protein [Hymenobacter sp. BT18]QIX61808.1 hypothetical protein HER32_11710 [Hymenobacter sp. BT18]
MMALFVATAPPALDELTHAYTDQQWLRVAEVAHPIKSSFYRLNVRSLQEPIRELESAASPSSIPAA